MSRPEGSYGIRLRLPIGNGPGFKSAGTVLRTLSKLRASRNSTHHDQHGGPCGSEDSLHSLHYLLNCTCKTAQDARQFFFGAFFGHVPTEWLKLPSKQHRTLANFYLAFLRSLRVRCGVCLLLALSWPKGPVKFLAYVAPKGVMLFDSNVRFK